MSYGSIETELVDLVDLLDFTLSTEFIQKWKKKYGERLLRAFQVKLLESIKSQKPLKLDNLIKYLVRDCAYNEEIIKGFLQDIDFEIYFPMISGSAKDLK